MVKYEIKMSSKFGALNIICFSSKSLVYILNKNLAQILVMLQEQ
jgi:hypothetical protein